MTNYEKFKDRLNKFGACGIKWGVKNGEPVWCDYNLECAACELHSEDSCCEKRLEWLDKEYKKPEVDWSKVPVDAHVLVSDDEKTWYRGHFSRYDKESGYYLIWRMGFTSFTATDGWEEPWRYAKLAEEE